MFKWGVTYSVLGAGRVYKSKISVTGLEALGVSFSWVTRSVACDALWWVGKPAGPLLYLNHSCAALTHTFLLRGFFTNSFVAFTLRALIPTCSARHK